MFLRGPKLPVWKGYRKGNKQQGDKRLNYWNEGYD
jgi:hypothetical protein